MVGRVGGRRVCRRRSPRCAVRRGHRRPGRSEHDDHRHGSWLGARPRHGAVGRLRLRDRCGMDQWPDPRACLRHHRPRAGQPAAADLGLAEGARRRRSRGHLVVGLLGRARESVGRERGPYHPRRRRSVGLLDAIQPMRRGQLKLVESGGLTVVNLVGVDDSVRGVVPRESPASWPAAPLEAQAVAARSYGLAEGGEGGTRFAWAKTCDDIFCQVYGGAGLNGSRLEQPSTDAAVAATAGEVLRYGDGRLARTEFSAASGGYTNGTPTCGTCAFPAVPDDGDFAAPYPNWGTAGNAHVPQVGVPFV